MSKRKSFGRFTAMSLAGISAVSSMAIVAYADAYPTSVYEFTYKGITSTALSAKAQQAIAANNKYVLQAQADGVFDENGGFKVTNLGVFGFDAPYASEYVDLLNSNGGSTWVYKDAKDFTGRTTPVLPEDYIKERVTGDDISDTNTVTFYFKTKAERDSALNTIASRNKADYTAKYNNAYKALSNELAKIADAHRSEEEKAAKAQRDADREDAKKDYKDEVIDKATYEERLDLIEEIYDEKMEIAKKNHDDRDDLAKVILTEFAEAYAPANRGFDHCEEPDSLDADDYAVFLVDDSAPTVQINGIAGSTYKTAVYYGVTATKTLNLENCKYRTQATFKSDEAYAFKGEIVETESLNDYDEHMAYLVAGDYWQQFSSSMQGGTTNNENTSEKPNTDKDDEKETNNNTTWYPNSASYRIPNVDGVSFRGKNNFWYTSSGAAEVYGGGYTGTTLQSNYSDVKGKAKVYFCAMDGRYYTTDANSYCYLVEENKTTTNSTAITDPYYYYYLMSQNGGYINTTTKIDPDAPTIYGSSKRSGWAKILSAVKSVKNGTVTIDMNAATTIPADVIKAAMANNVTIKAVNANGSIFAVDGSKVDYATSIDTTVQYNVKVVSNSLKNKAIKVNKGAVSTTQVVISEDGDLGADATVTVKLSAKRAGYTVKAYRVSSDGKKLTCEAKGTVKSNGSVNLNLDNGGKYVLVLIK